MTDEIAPRVVEFSADILEVGVGALTDNEVLKEIPVLGSAVKLAGIGKTIRDRIFLAKIRRFLAVVEPTEESRRFAAQLQSGKRDAERTAEVLLLAIDQVNDLEKAPILLVTEDDVDLSEAVTPLGKAFAIAVAVGTSEHLGSPREKTERETGEQPLTEKV